MNRRNKEKYLRLKEIFKLYNLTDNDMNYIWKIIKTIYIHPEFQRRMESPFFHHGHTTVGEHIIGDVILTYITCNKYDKSDIEIERAILIAMFHDLYVTPWKTSKKKELFINYHAFTHPIEAIINAITWFPKYFDDIEDAKIIIDGVLHHMYPCPVRAISSVDLELENHEMFLNIDDRFKKIITLSLKPCMSKNLSLRKSFYYEGRVLNKVDKIITIKRDLHGFKLKDFLKTVYGVIVS